MNNSTTGTSRIIALVDMDCFYVQVEERDDPSIKGKPAAVAQYKAYKGGGIIAVNYEARAKGINRNMRGDDAKAAYADVILVRVPETRGKADLTKYRDAGREVILVLSEFSDCVERASIDEAYIDLTEAVEKRLTTFTSEQDLFSSWEPKDIVASLKKKFLDNSFVLGYESTESWLEMMKSSEMAPLEDIKLAIGAEIVGEMREAVYQKTGFRCSAGIGHNKVLAKLTCGINKPNKQTVLPHGSVTELWLSTKIKKVRNLGGKLGDFLVEKLKCELMSDLVKYSEKELSSFVGAKTGSWIYQLARGYDDEPVNPRQLPKSIGCSKNFMGREALVTKERVKFWITQLSAEVVERVQKDFDLNNRRAKTMSLHVKFEDQTSLSRSCNVNPEYNLERITVDANAMMDKLYQANGKLSVNMLGLVASKFEEEIDTSGYSKIDTFFKTGVKKAAASSTVTSETVKESIPNSSSTSSSNLKLNQNIALPPSEASSSKTISEPPAVKNSETNNSSESEKPVPPPVRRPFFVYAPGAPPKPETPKKSPMKFDIPTINPNSKTPIKLPLLQECERCAKTVNIYDYIAHMDHHFAKDLSREINGLPPLGFDLRPATLDRLERERELRESPNKKGAKRPRGSGRGGASSSSGGSKRGRPAKNGNSSSIAQPVRTIDSYFNKQS